MTFAEINLALLQYKSEAGSGVPVRFVGIHHFGFQCDVTCLRNKRRSKRRAESFSSISASRRTTVSNASSKIPTALSSTLTGKAGNSRGERSANAVGGFQAGEECCERERNPSGKRNFAKRARAERRAS